MAQINTDEATTPINYRPALGTLCGLLSAVMYSVAHVLLRKAINIDPLLVTGVKALPSVLLGGLLVGWLVISGRRIAPSWPDILRIILAATVAHLAGNVVFQWALGVLGLAIGVPVTLGSLLVGSAVNGWLVLGESVSRRSAVTTLIVILSITVLSLDSESAAEAIQQGGAMTSFWMRLTALLGFCLAGFAYSVLGATVRWTGGRGMPVGTTMLISGMMGTILMAAICWWRLDPNYYQQVSMGDWTVMHLAAVCNAAAFLSIILALHFTKLLHVNLLNAAQAAFAAIAGVVIFQEPLTASLCAGVGLMALGFIYASRRSEKRQDAAAS